MPENAGPGDLDNWLFAMMSQYEDEREKYWREQLGDAEWSQQKDLREDADEVAEQITAASVKLVLPEAPAALNLMRRIVRDHSQEQYKNWLRMLDDLPHKLPPEALSAARRMNPFDEIEERPTGTSALRIVWERICIELARDVIDNRLIRAAYRQLKLVEMLVEANPPPPTAIFLRHVAQCFIWGFDAECVILCRSTIDTAFREAVSDEMCEKRRSGRPRHGFTLANRIEAASPDKIGGEIHDAALRVNERGTKAVHYEPEATTDVLGTIRDTVAVVRALSEVT